MPVVYVSLRDVPPHVRLKALPMAARTWLGEPRELFAAAMDPSERRYPVDEGAYLQAVESWRTAA